MIFDRIYTRLALNALTTGQYGKAEKHFKRAIRLNGGKQGLHYNCAVALMGAKKYSEAEEFLKKEIELHGEHYSILKVLAELYYNSGNRINALEYLEKTIEKCPDQAESSLLEIKLKNAGNEDKYKKCLEAGIYFEKGVELLSRGDWERAKLEFLHALDLDKSNPFIYNNLGYICMVKEKKYFQARELFQKALKFSLLPMIKQNLQQAEKLIEGEKTS